MDFCAFLPGGVVVGSFGPAGLNVNNNDNNRNDNNGLGGLRKFSRLSSALASGFFCAKAGGELDPASQHFADFLNFCFDFDILFSIDAPCFFRKANKDF